MENLIYYVGDIGPETTALFVHTKNIARILKLLEYQVEFFDYGYGAAQEQMGEFLHNHVPFDHKELPVIRVLERMAERIWGLRMFASVKRKALREKPAAIFLYGDAAEKKLYRFCAVQKIPLFIERCDWFEQDHYTDPFERNILYPRHEKLMERVDPKAAGILAISQFLSDHYRELGAHTTVIPPVFDLQKMERPRRRESRGPLRLVYAGSAGKENKDILWPAIEAVSRINAGKTAIEFHIIGPNQSYIQEKLRQYPLSMEGITVHGSMPHDKTEQMVASSDFSLLLRHNKRYAKAGFSTKLTESMSSGVPVICNRIGGPDVLLTDMENGVVLDSCTAEEIEKRLRSLLGLSEEELLTMKENAAEFASCRFDLHSYKDQLQDFLEAGRQKWLEEHS